MSQLSKDYARKARLRSLDTIAVKNNTSQDYIMWHDRLGAEPRRELVPKAQKDIGHGKGINHLPRFLAERYTTNMITQEITKISDEDWEKKKQQYRTLDETIQHAGQQIRTNDQKLWAENFPKIWLGVVKKYGGDEIPEPIETQIPDTGDPLKDMMEKTSLADKIYEPQTKDTKTT